MAAVAAAVDVATTIAATAMVATAEAAAAVGTARGSDSAYSIISRAVNCLSFLAGHHCILQRNFEIRGRCFVPPPS